MTTYYDTVNDIFQKYLGHHYDKPLYDHTMRVANEAIKIADSLLLSPQDKKLAYLIAVIHELGKFKDKNTIDLLFEEQLIKKFTEEEQYSDIIRDVIYSYEQRIFNEYYSDTSKLQLKVLNDADKLDRLYMDSLAINIENINGSKVSADILNSFSNHQECNPNFVKTPLDIEIARISYVFSLNFKYSYYQVEQNQYIDKIIANLNLTDPTTIALFNQLKNIVTKYMTEKMGETYHGW